MAATSPAKCLGPAISNCGRRFPHRLQTQGLPPAPPCRLSGAVRDLGEVRLRDEGARSALSWQRGGEKVGEQLVDALSSVVMDPVRGVGQALDAVEVGHIVALGLG